MILIAIQDSDLATKLKDDLYESSIDAKVINVSDRGFVSELYDQDISAVVADHCYKSLPIEASSDILNSIARRILVLVLKGNDNMVDTAGNYEFDNAVTIVDASRYNDILTTATLFGNIISSLGGIKARCKSIPFYNPQIPTTMLKNFGGLGILTIDAGSFNKISVKYGTDVYEKMKEIFNDILFDVWGMPGCFRDNDILCKKSLTSNSFYIFMNQSRGTVALPHPGALEKVAERVSHVIHNALWDELFKPRDSRRIPDCIESIPLVGVGFFGVLNNPCIEVHEILESGIEASKQMAAYQLKRARERQRELMQTLIQSQELLKPHYQAVFFLEKLTKAKVDEVKKTNSIYPLRKQIFGFESLIRVNQNAVERENSFNSGLDSKYLRPDVLFSLAKYTKVALELDQACMKHAAKFGKDLPGTLMVNILPRNLYYVEKLKSSFSDTKKLMFEISESEAISNFDLMLKSRDHLEEHNIGIAADDFGKGYSSLERIIKIRPHVIKFDQGMIRGIDRDSVKKAYVAGLVKAAKILDTTILAEGVETWDEAKVLKEMGVELVQGFLLHRPQESRAILEQLDQNSKPKKINKVS